MGKDWVGGDGSWGRGHGGARKVGVGELVG